MVLAQPHLEMNSPFQHLSMKAVLTLTLVFCLLPKPAIVPQLPSESNQGMFGESVLRIWDCLPRKHKGTGISGRRSLNTYPQRTVVMILLPFTEPLLCARHCAVGLTCSSLFNPHCNPKRRILSSLFGKGGNWSLGLTTRDHLPGV